MAEALGVRIVLVAAEKECDFYLAEKGAPVKDLNRGMAGSHFYLRETKQAVGGGSWSEGP